MVKRNMINAGYINTLIILLSVQFSSSIKPSIVIEDNRRRVTVLKVLDAIGGGCGDDDDDEDDCGLSSLSIDSLQTANNGIFSDKLLRSGVIDVSPFLQIV